MLPDALPDERVRLDGRTVDALLNELDSLAAGELARDEFYSAVAERLRRLGYSGVAVWTENPAGGVTLSWHHWDASADGGPVDPVMDRANVERAIASGEPQSGAAQALDNGAAERRSASPGFARASRIVPWNSAAGPRGALAVCPGNALAGGELPDELPVLAAFAEAIARFQAGYAARAVRERLEREQAQRRFTERVHQSLDIVETAYTIANDGRALVACSRVSVALRRGRSYRILAVSGAEHIHRHSPAAAQLRRLCRAVAATGEPLWQDATTGDLPPQLGAALASYLDASPAVALAVIPLVAPVPENQPAAPPVGALVFEQYREPFSAAARESIEGMIGHCRQALANAAAVSSIPGHRMWLALGGRGLAARWGLRSLLALAVIAMSIAALVLIPADVKIRARGELQPAIRHEVFAPRDGVVTAVHADHGDAVTAGQTLIAMRSSELELDLQRVQGELDTARKRLAAVQSERLQIQPGDVDARLRQRRLTAEEEQHQQQIAALDQRQKLLRAQLAELEIKAPISGQVVTWNARDRLASRPLRRGDALLTVADVSGEWQIELRVPSRQAGRFLAARRQKEGGENASVMLATNPGEPLTGKVTRIGSRAHLGENGESYLLVTVSVPREQIAHRIPGASAVGRISCGKGSLGEAWFYDLVDAVQLWLPF